MGGRGVQHWPSSAYLMRQRYISVHIPLLSQVVCRHSSDADTRMLQNLFIKSTSCSLVEHSRTGKCQAMKVAAAARVQVSSFHPHCSVSFSLLSRRKIAAWLEWTFIVLLDATCPTVVCFACLTALHLFLWRVSLRPAAGSSFRRRHPAKLETLLPAHRPQHHPSIFLRLARYWQGGVFSPRDVLRQPPVFKFSPPFYLGLLISSAGD